MRRNRRREKGSGIGKSHGEGGTNKESPIRERERETERGEPEGDAERWKKWEGETGWGRGTERRVRRLDLFLQDFVSVAQWSFSSSGKTFPLPLSISSSPSILLWLSFSVLLSSFLSVSAPPSTFLVSSLPVSPLSLSFPLSAFLPPCLKVSLRVHLPVSHTFCPYLRPSFNGLHPLLSSSRLLRPLFSQDASLQGVLHQNGTETEGEGAWSHAWFKRCKCGHCFVMLLFPVDKQTVMKIMKRKDNYGCFA